MTSFDLISAYRAGFRRGVAVDCGGEVGPSLVLVGLQIPVCEATLDCYQFGVDDGILGLAVFYEKVQALTSARSR